jgi:lipoprotein-releasing system ATP-binding protein
MSDAAVALALTGIRRGFGQGHTRIEVLRGVDLTLAAGEIVALVGPSGSGKSTLLQISGLLEPPDSGEVSILGEACAGLGDGRRTELRRSRLGFVYQFHHLLPEFSALENVMLPQLVANRTKAEARSRSHRLLARVGLEGRENHRPGQLSGGEQQRVAIARSLANDPAVLLADEPTGNLDLGTAEGVFAVLMDSVRNAGLAALIATHNSDLARRMDRVVTLRDGMLVTV